MTLQTMSNQVLTAGFTYNSSALKNEKLVDYEFKYSYCYYD
jgi:hypothetical protein